MQLTSKKNRPVDNSKTSSASNESQQSSAGIAPSVVLDSPHLFSNPEAFFRYYLGHHCRTAFNAMHRSSFDEYRRQIAEPLPGRTGRRLAIAAPRGAAKSTLHSMLFPIMDILSGRERHQVIISGTMQQAKNRIATITQELRTNLLLREAFFAGKVPRFKSNTRSIEIGRCRIEVYSAGSEMRGISHGEFRPTRIILDDVEQSGRMAQERHRNKLRRWYDEIVENLGDSYTHITIVGTIMHTDSLLAKLIDRAGYRGELYRSVMAWDNCPALWREWQRRFMNRMDGDAVATAMAFFEANKEKMLEGTEVLWPQKEPYVKLQEKLLVLGRGAFFKEKQNTPIKDGDQIFDTTLWTRFEVRDEEIIVLSGTSDGVANDFPLMGENEAGKGCGVVAVSGTRDACGPRGAARQNSGSSMASTASLKFYGFLDPAMGKSTTLDGDYAAIVTVGKAPDGTLYVWDVWMEKASPLKQVEQIFALNDVYNYEKFGFEANGFQETLSSFIHDEVMKRKKAGVRWRFPIEKHINTHSKHSRISLLEPHIIAGSIQFQSDLKQAFYVQADEYNGGRSTHDDGLDALASCVEMICKIQKPIQQIKSIRTRTSTRSPL